MSGVERVAPGKFIMPLFSYRQYLSNPYLWPQVQLQGQGMRAGSVPADQRERVVLGRRRQLQDPAHKQGISENLLVRYPPELELGI